MKKQQSRLNYAWRMFGTMVGFGSFGVGGLLMASVASPCIRVMYQDDKKRIIAMQKLIKYSFRTFIETMSAMGVMNYEIHGLEKLQNSRGELVIANHPMLLDVVMLIAFLPQANCVVKEALWHNPFLSSPVKNAGYIQNQGSLEFIEQCVERLGEPNAPSLIIFPEGTRTQKGKLLNEFARGTANIALRAGVPIRPVLIRCTPTTLTKNEKWYHIPKQTFTLRLDVLDEINVNEILPEASSSPKGARQLTAWLYHFFEQELQNEQFNPRNQANDC